MNFEELHNMDPFEFEILVGQVFAALNYNVITTSRTRDGGVDLIIDEYNSDFDQWVRRVVEVKRYKSTIGIKKIRELNGVLDIHQASFGCLVTLSDFKQGVKEKVKEEYSHITLKNGNDFYELLKNAGMIDSEGNLITYTDPNLEENRKRSILKILRNNQPQALTKQKVIEKVRSNDFITVSNKKIKKDISNLIQSGEIIKIEDELYYKPKQSEISISLDNLPDIIEGIDYFISMKIIYRLLEDYYSINRIIWETYFKKDISQIIKRLVKNSSLKCIGNDLYATPAAIEKFRRLTLDTEEIKENVKEMLGINDQGNEEITIKESKFYPAENEVKLVSGATENSKKLIPFLKLLFTRCPECGNLMVNIFEGISLLVTSHDIDNRLEELDDDVPLDIYLREINKRFSMSETFVDRLGRAYENYFSDLTEVDFNVQRGILGMLTINAEVDEDFTLQFLSEKVIEYCKRFQSFINEIYSIIEDYGRPIPVYSLEEDIKLEKINPTNKEGDCE